MANLGQIAGKWFRDGKGHPGRGVPDDEQEE